ncbi:gene transfer agent family protein [Brevundimonas sp.]|uniref:gene transfer agent family protein n=1 Tax=Brevundimonas sp. TaxID=1871086 RepID=UPI002D625C4C|nr:gene transfer agent family protein [Brevundimonas sp.]HYC66642.1 gene transfer agent family protein [Brevundimonas sp.]
MSRTAKVRLVFDEPRDFRLGIAQLEELQERTDAGPEEIFNRLGSPRWRVADVQQTLRLGLIGAGEQVGVAALLVERNASEGQLIQWRDHCRAILFAAMAGAPDEADDSEKPKRRRRKTASPAAKSGSAGTTS